MANVIELGGEHRLRPFTCGGFDGPVCGYVEEHPDARNTSVTCAGSIDLEGSPHARPGCTWRVVQAEPLTLEPSILCTQCGSHGFVRAGQWVTA